MKKRNEFLNQIRKEIPNSIRVEVESKVEKLISEKMMEENIMSKFEENNPERLKKFLAQLDELVDEFHPNLYLIDGVFVGVNTIIDAVREQLGDYKGL